MNGPLSSLQDKMTRKEEAGPHDKIIWLSPVVPTNTKSRFGQDIKGNSTKTVGRGYKRQNNWEGRDRNKNSYIPGLKEKEKKIAKWNFVSSPYQDQGELQSGKFSTKGAVFGMYVGT